MLERWLSTVYATLRLLPVAPDLQGEVERLTSRRHRTSRPTRAAIEAAATNRGKRLARFNEVKDLYVSGMPLLTISQKLSIDRKTVRAYAYAESFPERAPYPYVPNALTPYLDYLEKRHAEGCENASQLWREICARGFKQTKWYVLRWMAPRRREPSKHRPRYKKPRNNQASDRPVVQFVLPSAPQHAWLMVRDADELKDEEALVLRRLSQHRTFVFMQEHAKAFRKVVCQREAGELDAWLDTAVGSSIAQLKTFAEGLRRDYTEVKAALELPWSNGQTERRTGQQAQAHQAADVRQSEL